jgi:hypothetical protein
MYKWVGAHESSKIQCLQSVSNKRNFGTGTVVLLGWWRKELKDLWNNEDTSEKLETLTQSNVVQKN